MNAADVLDKAADVIERDGWCRHEYHDPEGRHCTVGAIEAAVIQEGHFPISETIDEAEDSLDRWLGQSVAAWNDDIARDVREVITSLRECAASLRSQDQPVSAASAAAPNS